MIKLLAGDCRDVLATLPAESVQCCVTSPPYFGLRDYGTALWDGGDAGCDHRAASGASASSGLNGSLAHKDGRVFTPYRDTCGKCGAVRVDRQIGLEATPDLYLETMVAVFREVRRVLRRDGTCWVNMGDSYAAAPSGGFDKGNRGGGALQGGGFRSNSAFSTIGNGYKPKDLLLMPARLALALQADGWWVRSDIIWHKPNPMPESVTDRPTSAHEHVFLLTKAARYYYDSDAIREPQTEGTLERFGNGNAARKPGIKQGGSDRKSASFDALTPEAILPNGRNARSVWTIATSPFSAAHFATFPPELAERCIKAGTSERGCCAACGKPWRRAVERELVQVRKGSQVGDAAEPDDKGSMWKSSVSGRYDTTTTGWSPGCQHCMICDASQRPSGRECVATGVEPEAPPEPRNTPAPICTEAETRCDVPEVRDIVQGPSAGIQVLQPTMFAQMDVGERSSQSLHERRGEQVSPYTEQREDDTGASAADGAALRAQASSVGRRSPHQRDSRRQPDREPDRADGRAACQDPHEQATGHKLVPYPVVPCTVLDPFAGAGTTLLCSDRLQRDAIGIELNTAYTEMAMERCRADAPLFTSFPPAEPPEDMRMADLFQDMAAD